MLKSIIESGLPMKPVKVIKMFIYWTFSEVLTACPFSAIHSTQGDVPFVRVWERNDSTSGLHTCKIIPVTGCGGLQSWDNWLTNDAKVVGLMRRPLFIPQEKCWYSFLLVAESTPGT
jgi:hypothetical protein